MTHSGFSMNTDLCEPPAENHPARIGHITLDANAHRKAQCGEICTLGLKRRGLETNSIESGASPRPYNNGIPLSIRRRVLSNESFPLDHRGYRCARTVGARTGRTHDVSAEISADCKPRSITGIEDRCSGLVVSSPPRCYFVVRTVEGKALGMVARAGYRFWAAGDSHLQRGGRRLGKYRLGNGRDHGHFGNVFSTPADSHSEKILLGAWHYGWKIEPRLNRNE